jgi:hypothetical protein
VCPKGPSDEIIRWTRSHQNTTAPVLRWVLTGMKGIFFRVNARRDLQSMANFMYALRFTKAFFAWVTKDAAIKLLSKVQTETILSLEVKQLNGGS